MQKIKVRLKERSYDIAVGRGLLDSCGGILKRLRIGRDAIVITNRRLLSLYQKPLERSLKAYGLTFRFELAPDSELAKSNDVVSRIITRVSEYDVRKQLFIIALGGGVVGDLAGFVAAVYKRGIPYVQIPTTLLAQVDSAIGGKVAVDLPIGKNLVGAFYQPSIVLSDTSFITTLPARQIRSGLAEIIKYGAIKDIPLFEFLEKNYGRILRLDMRSIEYAIRRSCRIKAAIVSRDEFDRKNIRAILNFGHTIGHAIEAVSGYSGIYNHGEAVAIGMVVASSVSASLGMIRQSEAGRIEELIEKVGLPTRIKGLKPDKIYSSHLHDKKFVRDKNRFILLNGIGRARVVEGVPESLVKSVLKERLSA